MVRFGRVDIYERKFNKFITVGYCVKLPFLLHHRCGVVAVGIGAETGKDAVGCISMKYNNPVVTPF